MDEEEKKLFHELLKKQPSRKREAFSQILVGVSTAAIIAVGALVLKLDKNTSLTNHHINNLDRAVLELSQEMEQSRQFFADYQIDKFEYKRNDNESRAQLKKLKKSVNTLREKNKDINSRQNQRLDEINEKLFLLESKVND